MSAERPTEQPTGGAPATLGDPSAASASIGGLSPQPTPELAGPSEQDIALYLAKLPEWRDHEGEHVLIYEGRVHGFFDTRTTALLEGFRLFGRVAFLVKQVDL